jgi:hypothetical protein
MIRVLLSALLGLQLRLSYLVTPRPEIWYRARSIHPALSQKGLVVHHGFTHVKSSPCLLHMSVAQEQAETAFTDGRL